jgi:monoamine oxidase
MNMSEGKPSKKNGSSSTKNSRRDFLKGASASAIMLGGAVVLPTAAAKGSKQSKKITDYDYDVVIIGGGFAGISAGRDSRENGYKTLILEARNRLGGRTFSSKFEGHDVELGGTWIHQSQPFVWAEKERYNLDVIETPGAVPDTMVSLKGGKIHQLTEADTYAIFEAFQAFVADGRSILERPYDLLHAKSKVLAADKMTARDRLDQLDLNPLQYSMMDSFIGLMAHNSSDNVSYLEILRWSMLPGGYFPLLSDAISRFKFKDGTESLIKKMLEDGAPDTRVSTIVKSVEDEGGKVKVTTARGEVITAGAVIVTVPMNVLPSIQFTPALDPKLIAAASERHTGSGIKIFVKVKGKMGKVSGFADSKMPLSSLFTYYEAEDHTLLCGFGGDPEKLNVYDDASVQAAVNKFFPDVEVQSSFSYDWVLDPFSKGTYCSYKPGWVSKYYEHFQKDRGRIIFGQGDHGEGWRGFIDGAIGAGIKSAQRVKTILG